MNNKPISKLLLCTLLAFSASTARADLAIQNASELAAFRDAVNNGNNYAGQTIYLTADIDLSGIAWTPINHTTDPESTGFQGTFDGRGYKISNMNVYVYRTGTTDNGTGNTFSGLFGVNTGTIKNLFLENPSSIAETQKNRFNACAAGAIAGLNGADGVIYNCCIIGGSVTSYCGYGASPGYACTGGITNNTSTTSKVYDCYVTGVSLTAKCTAGVDLGCTERTNTLAGQWSNNSVSTASNCCSSATDYANSWRTARNYAAWLYNNIPNSDVAEPYTWDVDGITPDKHYYVNVSDALAESAGLRGGITVTSPAIPTTYKRNDDIVDVYSVDHINSLGEAVTYILYPEGTTINFQVALEGWEKPKQTYTTMAGWFVNKVYETSDLTWDSSSYTSEEISLSNTYVDYVETDEYLSPETNRYLRIHSFMSYTSPAKPVTLAYTTVNKDNQNMTSVDTIAMNAAEIYGATGKLIAKLQGSQSLLITDLAGRIIYNSDAVEGEIIIELNPGIYIANGKKIVVK